LNVDDTTTGAGFSIRDYRPGDFDHLWHIDQRCFPPGISYSKLELSSFINRRSAITLVLELQSDNYGAELQGDAGEGVAGFAVAHAVRGKYGRILTLDILPEARRAGLGTKLMLACEERLRAAGCTNVYLETAVDNEAALRLYRKLGYEVLGVLPDYYASHSLDAFQMGKRL
jgi:ribosomal-protein-alanine N-acetyltransferase